MRYLLFILALFILLSLFTYGANFINRASLRREKRREYGAILALVELVVWSLVAIWGGMLLFKRASSAPITVIVLLSLLVALVGWFWYRDFLAGSLLKWEMKPTLGMKVKIGDLSGEITAINYRSIEIATKEGDYLRLPYSSIIGGALRYTKDSGGEFEHSFSLIFTSTKRVEELRLLINREIDQMAWMVPSNHTQLDIISKGEGSYQLKLLFYPITEEAGTKTEERLREFISKL